MGYLKILQEQEQFNRIVTALKNKISPVKITGTAESQKMHLAFSLCRQFGKGMIFVSPDPLSAAKAYDDIKFFAQEENCALYPAKDIVFYTIEAQNNENLRRRFDAINLLCNNKTPFIITTSDAFCIKTISKKTYTDNCIQLQIGATVNLDELCKKLVKIGYKNEQEVIASGQFSIRGGIIDVYPVVSEQAYRIELWDDEIDTIRTIDVTSQRSVSSENSVFITPASDSFKAPEDTICSYADNCFIFIDEPHNCLDSYDNYCDELSENIKQAIEKKYNLSDSQKKPEYYVEKYLTVIKKYENNGIIGLSSLSMNSKGLLAKEYFDILTKSMPNYNGNIPLLCDDLMYYLIKKYRVVFPCGDKNTARNLSKELDANSIPYVWKETLSTLPERGIVTLVPGKLATGFEYPLTSCAVICDRTVENGKSKKRKNFKKKSNIRSINDITEGDYVVHQTHGIGIYKGIEQLTVDNVTKDYLKISYKGADMLYVPVNQLNIINKYIGSEGAAKISKLGGSEWTNAKRKVQKSVEDLAKDLIELYAKRENSKGFRFSTDTDMQKDFEETFIYDETDDQLTSIKQVKKDMESIKPMDRLLCGDVGYGKTEVALRAAFKAVMDSKQVAYLVPTTLLARQHYETFVQRTKDFPVKVEMLSRFRTPKQQAVIIENLKKGLIDIVIGTHRIISDDVKFKDLGLLIIDEEQRFGVTHKEKIKKYKNNVDILTLTATPIPRTLNMAMTGLRDFSVLNDPPRDRLPVQTYVMEYNEEAVKNAIKREVARGGQVYYLHNRTETIDSFTFKLQKMLPDVRFIAAHGKMSERELENIMIDVLNGEYDVLVCTTIIETGLDIPNINTIIIENADRFGLAQLYQLRGRVGRSSRLAYAYLTVRKNKVLDEVAEKRLKAIKEFTEFGSGIKIAMRDLEIRGAGSVLGAKQHGHMNQVGYDLYCKLLASAVKQLKDGQQIEEEPPLTIDLAIDTFIPKDYIDDQLTRIDIYKTIAAIENDEDVLSVTEELIDRFGEPPKSVQNLIDCALIRNSSKELGITDIVQKGNTIIMKLSKNSPVEALIQFVSNNRIEFYLNSGKSTSLVYTPNRNKSFAICKNLKNVLSDIINLKNAQN